MTTVSATCRRLMTIPGVAHLPSSRRFAPQIKPDVKRPFDVTERALATAARKRKTASRRSFRSSRTGDDQAAMATLLFALRRPMMPRPASPSIIIAHVDGSGAPPGVELPNVTSSNTTKFATPPN